MLSTIIKSGKGAITNNIIHRLSDEWLLEEMVFFLLAKISPAKVLGDLLVIITSNPG
jgi:hypothetical protein